MIKFYLNFSCKVDVNGEDAAPIYKFLKSSKTGPFGDNIKWNFAKFLVAKQGGFFFFIFKKIKISKIYVGFGKFQKYTPVALWGGDKAQM